MAIRSRISEHTEATILAADNVIQERAHDSRGIVNADKDPFPDSDLERRYGDTEYLTSAAKHDAYVFGVPLPMDMRVQDLLVRVRLPNNPASSVERTYRKRIRSPLTAIRAFCVECAGGSPKAATNCTIMECPLWPFHRGNNAFRGKK